MKTNLNSLVKENLIKTKQKKENVLLQEKKIIKKRFNIITENKTLKTEKEIEKIINEGISEVLKLKKENFNEKLINEGFGEWISMFGRGAWEKIQENFFRAILKSLGMDETSFMADLISISLSNIKLSEITKLLDCRYVSGLMSKNLGETLAKQLQRKTGFESGFSDVLRNVIADAIGKSDIGQKMESTISQFICPTIDKMSNKFSETFGNKTPNLLTKPAG